MNYRTRDVAIACLCSCLVTWLATIIVGARLEHVSAVERAKDRDFLLRQEVAKYCNNESQAAYFILEMRSTGESLSTRDLGLIFSQVMQTNDHARLSDFVAAARAAQEARKAAWDSSMYAIERNEAQSERVLMAQ